jgi:hypothetical protein
MKTYGVRSVPLRLLMVNLYQNGDLKRDSVITIAKGDMGVGLPIDILELIPLELSHVRV